MFKDSDSLTDKIINMDATSTDTVLKEEGASDAAVTREQDDHILLTSEVFSPTIQNTKKLE